MAPQRVSSVAAGAFDDDSSVIELHNFSRK